MLTHTQLHYALSLLYRRFSQAERALDIWTRLASGEIRDAAFPGVGVIVAYLQTLRQRDIVFKYAKWLLASSNPATALLGADVFIGENAALFNPLEIHELIRAYGVGPEKRYLSYQINELSSMEETFHTRYATILVNALRVDATGADEPRTNCFFFFLCDWLTILLCQATLISRPLRRWVRKGMSVLSVSNHALHR